MPSAGFIGLSASQRRRRNGASSGPHYVIMVTGLVNGTAQDGAVLSYNIEGGTATAQRWQTSSDGSFWQDIADASGVSETISFADGTHVDGDFIRLLVEIGAQQAVSNAVLMTQSAPVFVQALAPQSFAEETGIQNYDASAAFAGAALVFAVSELTGVTIDPATGILGIDTDQLPIQNDTEITITASNSGGTLQTPLRISIQATPEAFLQEIAEEPVITLESGAFAISIHSGVFSGTYSTDHSGAPLMVSRLETAPMCLVRPSVSRSVTGDDVLTIQPGLWLYEGPDLGDQSWQQHLDGDDIPGGVDLMYTVQSGDIGKSFSVTETYGSQSVSSDPVVLSDGFQTPVDLGSALHTWIDLTSMDHLYTDQARTLAVTADGDLVGGVTDRSGNGYHAQASDAAQTTITWDASHGCVYISANNAAFLEGISSIGGATSDMHVYIGLRTDDPSSEPAIDRFVLIGSNEPWKYIGVCHDNFGTSLDAGAGTVSYKRNGVDFTPSTRADIFGQWNTGQSVVASAHGADLQAWNTTNVIRYLEFADPSSNLQMVGWVSDIVLVTRALTLEEETNLISFMTGRLPSNV